MALSVSTAAFAQDCFIASRSDRGSQQAGTHSQAWGVAFTLNDILVAPVDPNDPENSGLACTPAAAAAIVTAAKAAGLPTVFTSRTNKVIGENSNNPNLGNGKGLDHFDQTSLFNQFLEIAMAYEHAHPGSCGAFA